MAPTLENHPNQLQNPALKAEARAKIGAASRERGITTRPPISEKTRQKMRLAKLGRKHSDEHNARIAASLRRWNEAAPPDQKRRAVRRHLTEVELTEYLVLQRNHVPSKEALCIIGRIDLLPEGDASTAERPALSPASTMPRMTACERTYRRHLVAQRRPVTL